MDGMKFLFILKKREDSNEDYSYGISTGLLTSAGFVSDMLLAGGVPSRLVVVNDNNDIDREVSLYKPTHVIIEALWVVPEKFRVLEKLHPSVKWIVRIHSESPFLANEGMAIGWIREYARIPGVYLGVNSPRFYRDIITRVAHRNKVVFLPNFYPVDKLASTVQQKSRWHVDIGCFGAIRPLKNQLMQAMAAMKFADDIGANLRFHVNAGRVEMKGMPVLSNLRALFSGTEHDLVEHEWLSHKDFVSLVGSMDFCMQVSFSETFNIVAADSIASGVPTVISSEIPWGRSGFAKPTDMSSIAKALKTASRFRKINVYLNQRGLAAYVAKTRKAWAALN